MASFSRLPWQADAACLEHPEVNFFLEPGESAAPARAVCATCLVRPECLAFAIETRTEDGIFGGQTPAQRRRQWAPERTGRGDVHGENACYRRGCRCEPCTKANTDYCRGVRERKAAG